MEGGGDGNGCAILANTSVACWGAASDIPASARTNQRSIVHGGHHACALSDAGDVTCWGTPGWSGGGIPTPPASAHNQVFVAAGYEHSCAVSSALTLSCWGSDYYGELLDGNTDHSFASLLPHTDIVAVFTPQLSQHTCTINTLGSVACGGLNDRGQTNVPALLQSAVTLALGRFHSCALDNLGAVQCWGQGDPVAVPTGSSTGQFDIVSGNYHICALSITLIVSCWGRNDFDQISVSPEVASVNVAAIVAGGYYSCVLSFLGERTCWGAALGSIPSLPALRLPSRLPEHTRSNSPASTMTPMPTQSPTPGIGCPPSLFGNLPRTDLIGIPLSDAPLAMPSEGACCIACCELPSCDGYAFAFTELRFGAASCFLLANVTATTPANVMASGLRVGVALPSAPASASPVQTPLPAGGWPRRGGSVTPTSTSSATTTYVPTHVPLSSILIAGIPGVAGYNGDGGPASSAMLANPHDVASDSSGNLFIAEHAGGRIRKVSAASGNISTFAGDGSAGFGGDGGAASLARLNHPSGIALDVNDNLFIVDESDHRIRMVHAATGIITTVVGSGVCGSGGDGGPPTQASLCYPISISFSATGLLQIADHGGQRVRIVSSALDVISALAGTGVAGFSGDGGPATSAQLNSPTYVISYNGGASLIVDRLNNRIRRVTPEGIIYTFAGGGSSLGDGGPATAATLSDPVGMAIDGAGNVIISDRGDGLIRSVTPQGVISTLFTSSAEFISIGAHGELLVAIQVQHVVKSIFSPQIFLPSPSPQPLYCVSTLFRSLPHMDLVGVVVGTAMTPGAPVLTASYAACRQTCCDAPVCDGFSFASGDASFVSGGTASCFLYANITQLVPSSGYSSGIYESTL